MIVGIVFIGTLAVAIVAVVLVSILHEGDHDE